MRDQAAEVIRQDMGQIDLVVYNLASPVRQHPHTGELHRSSIKPLGEVLDIKTVHVEKGEVSEVSLEPATQRRKRQHRCRDGWRRLGNFGCKC